MFGDDDSFIYDPDYNHWKELQEPKDFNFESDFASIKDNKKKLF